MRHLNLTACIVLLLGSACIDLTPPHGVSDAGDGGLVDATVEQVEDAPADVAPPDAAPGDGSEGDAEAGDGGPMDAGSDAPNLHTGLIGYWKLDTEAGGVAIDSSGAGNVGTITGVPAFTTSSLPPLTFMDPGAFTFAAIDDAVVVQNSASLNPTDLTVALWVRFTNDKAHDTCGGVPTGLEYLFQKRTPRTNGNIEGVALIRTQDGRFGFILGNSSGVRTEIDDTPAGVSTLSSGIWYHVVGTFAANQARLYVNGVLTPNGLAVRTSAVEFETTPVYLARSGECVMFSTGDTNWDAELSGSLDDVRFYNRALTAAEVKLLYQGQDF